MNSVKCYISNKTIKKVFFIYPNLSKKEDDFSYLSETENCLNQINNLARNHLPDFRILKMDIFINCKNPPEFVKVENDIRRLVNNFELESRKKLFDVPILIIAQPPAKGLKVAIEITTLLLEQSKYNYEYVKNENSEYCKLSMGEAIEVYGFLTNSVNDFSGIGKSVYEIASNGFKEMKKILDDNILDYGNIVRQWGYIGGITNFDFLSKSEVRKEPFDSAQDDKCENYQMFNIARAEHYKVSEWEKGYPSATGIGANVKGCSIEFVAVNDTPDKIIIPLHNPRQIDAHGYTKKQFDNLQKSDEKKERDTPKFERGKIVITDNFMDIYVSGTAAIIGEDSVMKGISEQTQTTIDNILKLCSKENLKEHGIKIENDLPPFTSVRTYIKNKKDTSIVGKICRERFGDIPILYVIADVCREELLVEIEAYINCKIERSN